MSPQAARHSIAVTALVACAGLTAPTTLVAHESGNLFQPTLPAEPPYAADQRLLIGEPRDGLALPNPPERVEIFFRGLEFGLVPSSLELWIDGVEYTESLRFWVDRAWLDLPAGFPWRPGINTVLVKITDLTGNVFEESNAFDWAPPPGPDGLPWPFDDTGEPHVVSNLMEDWQSFGNDGPYWHSGIDIRADSGTPVKVVRGGEVVKVVNYVIQGVSDPDLYWQIAIQDDDEYIWQYHHVAPGTITVQEGDMVAQGDVLGEIVPWPSAVTTPDGGTAFYHHLHLNLVRYWGGGALPDPYEEGFTYYNPLAFLTKGNYEDEVAPASFEIWFTKNQSSLPVAAASDLQQPVLDGDIDIVTQLRDQMTTIPGIPGQPYELGIYEIAYEIRPKDITCVSGFMPRTRLIRFDAIPGMTIAAQDNFLTTIYKKTFVVDQMQYGSLYNGSTQRLIYVPTNTNFGVPVGIDGKWATDGVSQYGTSFPDGDYEVTVFAKDFHGNETATSVDVTVANNLDANPGCPGWISSLDPWGSLELTYGSSGQTELASLAQIPVSFAGLDRGSATDGIDHTTWPVLTWDLPTMGVRLAIGLLEGQTAEVEYVPYLGDVILEIPAEAQMLPLAAGASFDPQALSANPVDLRLSTRLARDPVTGLAALGTPHGLGGTEFELVLAAEISVSGMPPMVLRTEPGGLSASWNVQSTGIPEVVAASTAEAGSRAYPNPFRPRTTIEYTLPEASIVHMGIFDVRGARVRTFEQGALVPAGSHATTWDGRSDDGRSVPSGVYFYRIDHRAHGRARAEAGRLVLLR